MRTEAVFVKNRVETIQITGQEDRALIHVDRLSITIDGTRTDIDAVLNLLIKAGWKLS